MTKRRLLVVLSLIFFAIPALSQDDNPWGDGQVIVYVSDRNGNNDLFMMTMDGSYEIQLTYDTSHDSFPSFSPLGGSTIAFQSNRSGSWQIYTLSLITGEVRQITTNGDNYYPAWSPDGTQLVFSHIDDTTPVYQLYVVDLTAEIREVRQLSATSGSSFLPDWSPDGTQIVMSESDGDGELWLVNAQSGAIDRRLTDNESWETDPKFSPNGRYIVHTSGEFGMDEIYVRDLMTDDLYRLTENVTDDIDPVWSPDGKYIIFASNRDGNRELYSMARNGEQVRRLTENSGVDAYPSTGILGYWIRPETFVPQND